MKNFLLYVLIILLFISGLIFEVYKIKPVVHSNRNIKVYIVGAVKNPGVYEINEDSRVEDIIIEAGGLSEVADSDRINLAARLMDGEKLNIPSLKEETEVNDYNLTKKEWKSIKGIGEKKAELIMNYIKANESFELNDLEKIKGISKSNVEEITKYFNRRWIYGKMNFGGIYEKYDIRIAE